jgi:uncharacterized protein (DUF305 family)
MPMLLPLAAALGLLVVSAVGDAAAQDAAGGAHHSMPMAGQEAAKALQHGMATMDGQMRAMPLSGNPDRDFARMMIVHHQGAIDMARTQLEFGTDPDMRKLAEDVIAAQEKEIAFMEAWLAKQSK